MRDEASRGHCMGGSGVPGDLPSYNKKEERTSPFLFFFFGLGFL